MLAATVTGVAVAIGVAVFAASGASVHPRKLPVLPEPDDSPAAAFTKADLDRCASGLVASPSDRDAASTDPRGRGHGVGPVLQSTGCRAEIQGVLDGGIISADERRKLETWADAEAHLDATVSMVAEYYKGDPYALDGYSTAPQLWTEYNRALVIRNDALTEWRRASH